MQLSLRWDKSWPFRAFTGITISFFRYSQKKSSYKERQVKSTGSDLPGEIKLQGYQWKVIRYSHCVPAMCVCVWGRDFLMTAVSWNADVLTTLPLPSPSLISISWPANGVRRRTKGGSYFTPPMAKNDKAPRCICKGWSPENSAITGLQTRRCVLSQFFIQSTTYPYRKNPLLSCNGNFPQITASRNFQFDARLQNTNKVHPRCDRYNISNSTNKNFGIKI